MKKISILILNFILIIGIVCSCTTNELAETKEEKNNEIVEVEELISAIGEVSINSRNLISSAYMAYDSLPDEMKSKVENADVLISADNKWSQDIIDEIVNEKMLTADQAYKYIQNCYTKNEELLDYIELIENMKKCEGTFYQNGKYETTVIMYLQYGEPWFQIDYPGYSGSIEKERIVSDGEDGFLFKVNTTGSHTVIFTGDYMIMDFTIRFGEKKLYIEWGRTGKFYLSRAKDVI